MLNDLLMALKGIENGVFQIVESPMGKRFVYLKRSNSNTFAAQGEIDVINKLLVYGTQRMKIQDYIDETDEVITNIPFLSLRFILRMMCIFLC